MARRRESKITNYLILVVVFVTIFFVGASLFSNLATQADATEVTDERADPLVTVDQPETFEDDVGYWSGEIRQVYRVNDSTGLALELTGASDSTYTSDQSVKFADDGTWTISVWAEWNDSYNTTNGTVYSLDGKVALQYDNQTSQWVGWYYNESSTDSYRVNASAPEQPNTLTNIQLSHNGTHFAIAVNGTTGEVDNTTVSSIEDPLQNTDNWAGRQEELRGYDDGDLSAAQSQQLIDKPVQPLNNANRTFRVMFDQGSGNTEPVYFSSSTLTLSNSTYVSGHPGHVLTEGTDYEIDAGAGTITALSGGLLDTAPTAFVYYRLAVNPAVMSWTDAIEDGWMILTIMPILLIAIVLIYMIPSLQTRNRR